MLQNSFDVTDLSIKIKENAKKFLPVSNIVDKIHFDVADFKRLIYSLPNTACWNKSRNPH